MRVRLLILLVLAGECLGAALDEAAMDALFARLAGKRLEQPLLTMTFREEKRLRMLEKPVIVEGRLELAADGRFRREIPGDNASITVHDGSTIWIHYPAFDEVEAYDTKTSPELRSLVAALTAGFRFEGRGSLYRANVETLETGGWRIRMLPEVPEVKRLFDALEIVVDAELDVESTEYRTPRGDVIHTRFLDPRPLEPAQARLEFAVPPGATVSRPLEGK